jgi:hypothetical protein
MILPPKVIHPTGEPEFTLKKSVISALIAETFNGKIHIEWDPQAQVTTLGQLAFFIQYLKMGHRFMPWVEECPLRYISPKDAQRFYEALEKRLNAFNLKVAENKTHLLVFSRYKIRNGASFNFLGFEFRWGLSCRINKRLRFPIFKRRTSREKLYLSLANFKVWLKKSSRLPKNILFAMLNRKLRGYYNYYEIIGN